MRVKVVRKDRIEWFVSQRCFIELLQEVKLLFISLLFVELKLGKHTLILLTELDLLLQVKQLLFEIEKLMEVFDNFDIPDLFFHAFDHI